MKQTNKQCNKQWNKQWNNEKTNQQTSKQTNKQANKQTNKQTNQQTNKQWNKQTHKQTNNGTSKQKTSKQAKKQTLQIVFQLQNWKLWRWLRTSGRKLDGDPRNRVLVKTDHSKPPIFVQDWTKSLCKFTKSLHCKLTPLSLFHHERPVLWKQLDGRVINPYEKFAKNYFLNCKIENRRDDFGQVDEDLTGTHETVKTDHLKPPIFCQTPYILTSRGSVSHNYYPSSPLSVIVGARIRKERKER